MDETVEPPEELGGAVDTGLHCLGVRHVEGDRFSIGEFRESKLTTPGEHETGSLTSERASDPAPSPRLAPVISALRPSSRPTRAVSYDTMLP